MIDLKVGSLAFVLLMASLVITSPKHLCAQDVTSAPTEAAVEEFIENAFLNNQQAIEEALDGGMDVNARTPVGLTAYHVATMNGHLDLARLLVDRGVDITIPRPEPEELANALLGRDIQDDSAAIVAVVARNGEVIYEKSFGYADIANKVKANTDTIFRIGSVTKQFTAAAILKLQEQGKLNVSDPLAKYFPDYPDGDNVTLHHLLTHTSGIRCFTYDPDFMSRVTTPIDIDDFIDEIREYEFDFEPGEDYKYSNSGYIILGRIVELVSGQSYGEYLKAHFFKPLGMNNTGVYEHDASYANEALGYQYADGRFEKARPWHMSWTGGAGQIYSTVHDLVRWNEGVFGGKALGESSIEAAFKAGTLNDGSATEYGYGWGLGDLRGVKSISHSGSLDGFFTDLTRYPEHNVTIAIVSNCVPRGPGLHVPRKRRMLAVLYLWESMRPGQRSTPH